MGLWKMMEMLEDMEMLAEPRKFRRVRSAWKTEMKKLARVYMRRGNGSNIDGLSKKHNLLILELQIQTSTVNWGTQILPENSFRTEKNWSSPKQDSYKSLSSRFPPSPKPNPWDDKFNHKNVTMTLLIYIRSDFSSHVYFPSKYWCDFSVMCGIVLRPTPSAKWKHESNTRLNWRDSWRLCPRWV